MFGKVVCRVEDAQLVVSAAHCTCCHALLPPLLLLLPPPASEEKDLRITKLPAGVSSILVEPGPNPANDNSAVWVNYQVRFTQGTQVIPQDIQAE